MKGISILALVAVAGLASVWRDARAETPDTAAIWAIVQQQQAEIDALRRELDAVRGRGTTQSARSSTPSDDLFEDDASFDAGIASPETTIAGYGEVHFNNVDTEDGSGDFDRIDQHRFVLFVGRRLGERASFYSELEVEHALAGEGEPGEVELEQAFVDFRIGERLGARAGLFLVPVGILNETHEPPTFFGVERNDVENVIIPSTWWEAGGAVNGRFGKGWSWETAIHSGLAMPITGNDAFRVRSGRQAVAEALANDFALTGRIRYGGIRGLQWSASVQHQSDPSQAPGDGLDSGLLFETDLVYQRNRIGLRALYASWNFNGTAVEAAGVDRQTGWYLEPSYRLSREWGFYARYAAVDAARAIDRFDQWEVGANYWPVPRVVVKLDYRQRDHAAPGFGGRDFAALDIGFGYQF